ncbi:MAG: VOC family protein [Dehalococcoidia bacterium]|nr:VOC family protein [Dehalococcoidia bacterium]
MHEVVNDAVIVLPPVHQIGLVVRDLQKAADFYYSTFGIGPFSIVPEVSFNDVILRGQPTDSKIKVGFADSGPIQIELIQPIEGENIYTEFLQAGHEGLHHLGFEVDNFEGMLAKFKRQGIEPVFWKSYRSMAFAYMDTGRIGGVIVELLWHKRS